MSATALHAKLEALGRVAPDGIDAIVAETAGAVIIAISVELNKQLGTVQENIERSLTARLQEVGVVLVEKLDGATRTLMVEIEVIERKRAAMARQIASLRRTVSQRQSSR